MKTTLKKLGQWTSRLSLFALPLSAQAVQVDVLVAYDAYTKSYYSGQPVTAIRSLVSQVNTIYKNSGVDIQLRLVGTMENNESGTNMTNVLYNLRADSAVASKRNSLGADFVVQLHKTANCGVAFVSLYKAYSYAVAGPKCGPNTVAHELGHTMGLKHSRKQGDTTGVKYKYGLGHGVNGSFATIMAYNQAFSAPKVPKFSNPNLKCNGLPCGIAAGKAGEADAARALNNVKSTIAAFYPTKVSGTTTTSSDSGSTSSTGSTGSTSTTTTTTTKTPTTTTTTGASVGEGVFALKAKSSGLCANVASGSTANGALINQWSCHLGNSERWTLKSVGSGYYELRAKHSGKCLEVGYASKSNGYKLRQNACQSAPHQQWKFIKNSDGSYQMEARHSGKAAQVASTSTSNGVLLTQYDWNNGANQNWVLQRLQ